jgi:hypothetical protein
MILTIYACSAVIAFAALVWYILGEQLKGVNVFKKIVLFRVILMTFTPLLNTLFSIGIIGIGILSLIQELIKLYYYVKASNRSTTRSRKG